MAALEGRLEGANERIGVLGTLLQMKEVNRHGKLLIDNNRSNYGTPKQFWLLREDSSGSEKRGKRKWPQVAMRVNP